MIDALRSQENALAFSSVASNCYLFELYVTSKFELPINFSYDTNI